MYDKPGCFGHAITFNTSSKACLECDEFGECQKVAVERIKSIESMVNTDAIVKLAHKKPKKSLATPELRQEFADLPATAQKLIAMIPDNAKRIAAALVRSKINFRKELLGGNNPIRGKSPVAISVLFDLLLQGPVDRNTYMLSLKERLGHSPATAASQATIGVAVTTGLGITKLDGDKLIIRS